jgi:hypothetical protein
VGDRKSVAGLNKVGCSKNSDQLEVSGFSEYDSIMQKEIYSLILSHTVLFQNLNK